MIDRSVLNILVVEDNPDHALLVKKAILSSKNRRYMVDAATTAEEAMTKVKNSSLIHMILSDYNLPGMNGLEFLEWLNQQTIDIPFVMVTGRGDEKLAVKAMQEGAYNYIVKDDTYLTVLPHVVDETFIRYLAVKEKEKYEREIREKNAALEKANRELKKLDQLKSDFVASVSHDIRTPLNCIKESIALILDGVVNTSQEQGKKVLEIAKRSINRLTIMIDDLLDFSKLEAGKVHLHIESCDIQVLIDEVLGSLRNLAEKKKIKLNFQPADNFSKIECDPERMVQVLTNLIGNAIKFTSENGTINVSAHAAPPLNPIDSRAAQSRNQSGFESVPSGRVLITVADTGVGIRKEDLDRIFDRFEQVQGAASKENKGTGLGLSICKELVKLHGGDVWAESEFGKGSRFTVSIPIAQHTHNTNIPFIGERAAT